ncbi:MAG TPA: MFS transporter [Mycobacteriales bacterium]|nr:MFS transporter [Mycobacteriales bacterium]
MTVASGIAATTRRSLVPARMDRLPWGPFHTKLVIALGITWVLDGLEITIASAVGDVLREDATLGLTAGEVGLAASVYLAGEVVGALFFGRLSDHLGRRKLFIVTLGLYLVANGLTAFSFDLWIFFVFRFFAGMGIGGEYAAINSAIDELIPARHRGHTDLAINGTYWLGAMLGAASQFVLLNPDILPVDIGWRIGFLIGPIIGLAIWGLRRHLPESPRWLLMHGRADEAEATVEQIEKDFTDRGYRLPDVDDSQALEIVRSEKVGFVEIAGILFRTYPKRTVVGFALGISQSFLYNAIFFTYVLVLTDFYGVPASTAALYLFPFAFGNLLGPLLLGRLFDTIGRKPMIAGTYAISGILLAITGYLFEIDALTAVTQTILWCVIFFFASAAASSAYLTVSEVFPLELRAQAIAFFFAVWQLVGGVVAPWVFGTLIGTGDRGLLFVGYLVGAGLMVLAAVIQLVFGVEAARRSLEDIARPLSAVRSTGVHPWETPGS